MRLIVNDSWSMMLQYEPNSDAMNFQLSNPSEIERTVNFLKWQTQMQVEIHERIEYDNTRMTMPVLNDTLRLQTPAATVYDYLTYNGIDVNRIHLAGADKIDQATFQKIKGCEVELILLPENGLNIPDQRLSMEHKIRCLGELPIEDAVLITSIPEGFILQEDSAVLDTIAPEFKINKNNIVTWELGGQSKDTTLTLNYDLIPMDPPNIRKSTAVMSYLQFKTPKGKAFRTDTLNTSIATRVEMIKFDVTLEGALFDVGSYVLKPAAKASIRNIGEFMNWKTDVNILVEGFTDHTGSEEDNLVLSQNRANSVRDYLINEYHISPDRIETTGYGEAFPVADNNTREGRALNRRVEIIMNSNFEQKGLASDPILRDDTKISVENKRIETINEDMPQ
jgi:outer membrane protein OmpA-like peptidoglycan-associated protein